MESSAEKNLFPKSLQAFVSTQGKIGREAAEKHIESIGQESCKNALEWLKKHPEVAKSSSRIRFIQEALQASDQRTSTSKRHLLSLQHRLAGFLDAASKKWDAVVNERKQITIDEWVETKVALFAVQKQLKELEKTSKESSGYEEKLHFLQEEKARLDTELYVNLPVEIESLRDNPLEEADLNAILDCYECGVLTGPLVNEILKQCVLNVREPTHALERLQPERLRVLLPLLLERLQSQDLLLVLNEQNKAGQTLFDQYFAELPEEMRKRLEQLREGNVLSVD